MEIQPNKMTLIIGGSEQTVSVGNKAELAVRNRAIEWKNFSEYLEKQSDKDAVLREFVMRFFNIVTPQQDVTEMLDKYYKTDPVTIVKNLRKMFFLHEPLAWALRELFFKFTRYYETILRKIVEKNGSWTALIEKWTSHNYDTSSFPLWNLTYDKEYQTILSKHPGMTEWLSNLNKTWAYKGFCPKVPHERVQSLMEFPIKQLLKISGSSTVEMDKFASDLEVLLKDSKSCDLSAMNFETTESDNDKPLIEKIMEREQKLLPALRILENHYLEKTTLINEIIKIFPCGCAQI